MGKWAVRQEYRSSGRIVTTGPVEVPDYAKSESVENQGVDIYIDVFDTQEAAQEFIDTELTE